MKFGDNLKNIRKSKKMSQEQLAEKVNVSRQAVSKWENGEAYPEMNNILQLCKIFNCKINDIVHTDMSDISSLDKEIIMNVVKFNEKKQSHVKGLSNVISIISKIGKIILKVAIPFIVIAMILLPYIISNIQVSDNEISFKTDNLKIDGDYIEVFNLELISLDELQVDEIINIFSDNSKVEIIAYIEIGLLFLIANIVVMIIILGSVEKLFNNIKNNHTPFTLDNVNYIKKISYFMIALIIVNPLSGIIFGSILGVSESSSGFELISIVEILIIFSMSYIFEYGYEIQKDSNRKMYSE